MTITVSNTQTNSYGWCSSFWSTPIA